MKAKIIKTSELIEVYQDGKFYKDEEGKVWHPKDIDLICIGDKGIKELSKEYAEDMCSPAEDYLDKEEREVDMGIYWDDAFCVLDWLMRGGYI